MLIEYGLKYANFCTDEDVEEILENESSKVGKYSATLSQEPENILEVEEPSSNLCKHGVVYVKSCKRSCDISSLSKSWQDEYRYSSVDF